LFDFEQLTLDREGSREAYPFAAPAALPRGTEQVLEFFARPGTGS
jgi:hypothetical protein